MTPILKQVSTWAREFLQENGHWVPSVTLHSACVCVWGGGGGGGDVKIWLYELSFEAVAAVKRS